MTVLTSSEAFLGIPFPNHKSGQSKPQSFLYPGAIQPNVTPPPPNVLTNAEALLGIQYPQKIATNTKVQSFLYPGAVQPIVQSVAVITGFRQMIFRPQWDQTTWGWNP